MNEIEFIETEIQALNINETTYVYIRFVYVPYVTSENRLYKQTR